MSNNISFKSNIRIVSPHRFKKLSQGIFRDGGEFISDFNTLCAPYRGIDFLPYRTRMNAGFTLGVRSCTAALVATKNKVASLFMHLFNSRENIGALDKIKHFFVGDSCILIGSKNICPHSRELFRAVEAIASNRKLPITKMQDMQKEFEADIAYKAKNDTVFLCVKNILDNNNYAKTE